MKSNARRGAGRHPPRRFTFSEAFCRNELIYENVAKSKRLLVNLPPDQHAADLARPGADLVELGVAQQPAGREIVDVAVAAEALDRLQRHPGRTLGRVEDDAGRVLAGDAAVVTGAGDRIDIGL